MSLMLMSPPPPAAPSAWPVGTAPPKLRSGRLEWCDARPAVLERRVPRRRRAGRQRVVIEKPIVFGSLHQLPELLLRARDENEVHRRVVERLCSAEAIQRLGVLARSI